MSTSEHAAEEKETGRLEAFSDGVFAIAITLLVLTLQAPDTGKPAPQVQPLELASALARQWPSYLAYLISFVFILIMWVNHHNLFRMITRVDHTFLLLNGLLLMFITIVPFPTNLVAQYVRYPAGRTATAVFSGTYVLIAVCYNLLWRYASRNRRLLSGPVPQDAIDATTRSYRFGPLLYLLCFFLAFVSVGASLIVNCALAVFFALPRRAARANEAAVPAQELTAGRKDGLTP